MNQRLIELPGVFNFRDVGGYSTRAGRRTRWGRLYRSGDLHRLESAGVEKIWAQLGLRTIIDLRWPDDLERAGTLGLLAGAGIRRHSIPLGNAELLAGVPDLPVGLAYLPLAAGSADAVVRIAQTLAAERALPAVVHCSAGKDRTGIVTALLLALLGVDDVTIVQDYALTAKVMPRWIAHLVERGELPPEPTGETFPGDEVAPDAIQNMLDTLRTRHGSIEDYFLFYGLAPEETARLRDSLLD